MTFHPYFFGDELNAYQSAKNGNHKLLATFWDLAGYKPRLVWDFLLDLVLNIGRSRWVLMLLVAIPMATATSLVFLMVSRWTGRYELALLSIAILLTSRFGVLFYFDYVSGSLEALSLCLLMVLLLCMEKFLTGEHRWKAIWQMVLLAVILVFVHERWAVPMLLLGLTLSAVSLVNGWSRRVSLATTLVGLLPLGLFALANALIGKHNLTMGSAGQEIAFGFENVVGFTNYISNIFLNQGIGAKYLWGNWALQSPAMNRETILWLVFGLLTVSVYVLVWLKKGFEKSNQPFLVGTLAILFGLIIVACLPSRHEPRWVYPVAVLVLVLGTKHIRFPFALTLGVLSLSLNSFLLLVGNQDGMAQVYSSRAAQSFGQGLETFGFQGARVVVSGNQDDRWTFGGPGLYSEANFGDAGAIFVVSESEALPQNLDYGMVFRGFLDQRRPQYELLTVNDFMTATGRTNANDRPIVKLLGGDGTWPDWRWSRPPQHLSDGIVLSPGMNGFLPVQAENLGKRYLVYSVRSALADPVPMRVQVNWHDASGKLVQVFIKVYQVNSSWTTLADHIEVPPSASVGEVYLQLDDKARDSVVVRGVSIR
jgi:hypothetical protein